MYPQPSGLFCPGQLQLQARMIIRALPVVFLSWKPGRVQTAPYLGTEARERAGECPSRHSDTEAPI